MKNNIVIGYGGHSYVAIDILLNMGVSVTHYCDNFEKLSNPYNIAYAGTEKEWFEEKKYNRLNDNFFIAVGDNRIREKVFQLLQYNSAEILNAVHPKANIANSTKLGIGIMVAASAVINPFCIIANGVICNTSASIDHECFIDEFAHIAPGAVLCGNIKVGKRSFIGANAVVKEGIIIGDDVIVGAGSVVIKNIASGEKFVGNPQRKIK